MSRKSTILAAALIILVAAALRLFDLTDIPPGLHYDEATNGVIARDIAFGGYRPLFIASFTGKETLWFYLAALVMRLVGPDVFALRLTSVLIGTLSVAATGWVVQRLYAGDSRRDGLALLAMAVLAVAFWHGVLSRLAFRAISQPLMQALSLGLLLQGLRTPARSRRHLVWMAVAGMATGLTAYTYLAARLFPVPVAVALVVFIVGGRDRLALLRGVAVYGLAAALVFAPLGVFFLRNPETFGTRIGQVAPATPGEVLEGWRLAARMFFVSGDPLWRFNLPGKPIFGPVLGIFFVAGVVAVVHDVFHAGEALDRARGALLLVWLPVMLAPTALAVGGITPSNLRAVGLAPLIALYPALGIMAVAAWLRGQSRVARRTALPAVLALTVFAGGGLTLRDLVRWGGMAVLYYDNDGHVVAAANYLNREDIPPDTTIYTATFHFRHPTLAFLARDYAVFRSLFGGDALALAASGDTLALYTRDALPPEEWREALGAYQIAAPPGPDGTPDFYAFLLPDDFSLGWPGVKPVDFGNIIALEGAALHPAKSGSAASVDMAWRALGSADQPDYAFVAEVCDAWDWCWIKTNLDGTLERGQNNTYNSTQWSPGERLFTRLTIPLPQGMPPGSYTVRVSVFSAVGGGRLPVLDEAGGFAGFYAGVDGLRVEADRSPQVGAVPMQRRVDRPVTSSVTLLGYDMPGEAVRPGERIDLALYWLCEEAQAVDHDVVLSLGDGTVLYRGEPVHGTYPVSAWRAGELVTDRYGLRLPRDMSPGEYTLVLRLGEAEPVTLGTLRVEASARCFDLPGGITLLDPLPVFGGWIALAGYDTPVGSVSPGGELPFTLVWRSEVEMESGYTVFVHLVDGGGSILAQQDRPPQTGGEVYPTDLWLPGEVVEDDYALSIPPDAEPGAYTLRVGLYLPENGQRLALPGSADNAFILPVTVIVR